MACPYPPIKGLAMPIYAYRCESCGHAQDVLQRLSDPLLTVCPACGAPTYRKQLTAAGFQLKGSGWYATDFRGGATSAKPEGESEGKAESGDTAKEGAGAADKKPGDAVGKPAAGADAKPAATPQSAGATPPPPASAPAGGAAASPPSSAAARPAGGPTPSA
jgi:putative FmdB family regulatory protein